MGFNKITICSMIFAIDAETQSNDVCNYHKLAFPEFETL